LAAHSWRILLGAKLSFKINLDAFVARLDLDDLARLSRFKLEPPLASKDVGIRILQFVIIQYFHLNHPHRQPGQSLDSRNVRSREWVEKIQ